MKLDGMTKEELIKLKEWHEARSKEIAREIKKLIDKELKSFKNKK